MQDENVEEIAELITEMTLKGAPTSEMVRVIRFATVAVDNARGSDSYQESFDEENIAELLRDYH